MAGPLHIFLIRLFYCIWFYIRIFWKLFYFLWIRNLEHENKELTVENNKFQDDIYGLQKQRDELQSEIGELQILVEDFKIRVSWNARCRSAQNICIVDNFSSGRSYPWILSILLAQCSKYAKVYAPLLIKTSIQCLSEALDFFRLATWQPNVKTVTIKLQIATLFLFIIA